MATTIRIQKSWPMMPVKPKMTPKMSRMIKMVQNMSVSFFLVVEDAVRVAIYAPEGCQIVLNSVNGSIVQGL